MTAETVLLAVIALVNGFGVALLQRVKKTGESTHIIVNSQKTAMEKAIQDLRVTVARLKRELGLKIEPDEMPNEEGE